MLSPLETSLIALLLIVLMFGMGATLTWQRFRELAQHPRAFLIGTASQFGWMPLLAFVPTFPGGPSQRVLNRQVAK
jgi:BASS family bile acid:Na+ symporter